MNQNGAADHEETRAQEPSTAIRSEAAPLFSAADFRPHCIVCTTQVPERRARSRNKDTCSPECHKILTAYRKKLIFESRCPACYHPSTPEQRADYIAWRKERGHVRQKAGRPAVKREEKLLQALQVARVQLKAARDQFAEDYQNREFPDAYADALQRHIEQLDTKISEIDNLLIPLN